MNAPSCPSCAAAVLPGAILCASCGSPLAVAASPSSPLAAPVAVAQVRELAVVEGGPSARIIPPAEGGQLTLGRHDLTRQPPWVVDVDLGRLMAPTPTEGLPVSRDQALLSRRAGELLLTPRGQAPVLRRAAGAADYQALPGQTAHAVRPGDRLVFGHGARVLVLEAR